MARKSRGDAKAAAVMVAGSAAFLAAAVMPVARVFAERDPERRLAILRANTTQWRVQQQLFAAGTAGLPVGVLMLARDWDHGNRQNGQGPAGQRLAQAAALEMAAGAGFFLVDLKGRYSDPEAFALGRLPSWPFLGYSWLNLAGMAALGSALLVRSKVDTRALPAEPRWPGWLNLGGSAVFAGALAVTRDLPPFLVYGVELATGVALIRKRPSGARPALA